jgi:hypothetical protein
MPWYASLLDSSTEGLFLAIERFSPKCAYLLTTKVCKKDHVAAWGAEKQVPSRDYRPR